MIYQAKRKKAVGYLRNEDLKEQIFSAETLIDLQRKFNLTGNKRSKNYIINSFIVYTMGSISGKAKEENTKVEEHFTHKITSDVEQADKGKFKEKSCSELFLKIIPTR